ncbi:MAG: hypothetical protein ACTHKC_09205 [Candidatus Nitrosocosmicus sp.]
MSQFNSTNPASMDSEQTKRTKADLTELLKTLFKSKGFKIWVYEEVYYVHKDEEEVSNKPIPYHLDLICLTRDKEIPDLYSVFGIELDWKVGHGTPITDNKDEKKDMAFYKLGVPVIRFRLEEFVGKKKLTLDEIKGKIWHFFAKPMTPEFCDKNCKLAIKLKENAFTFCPNTQCGHKASQHDLNGCSFRYPNKAAKYCYCKEPFITSHM